MDLSYLLLTGSLSGLVSVLTLAVLDTVIELLRGRTGISTAASTLQLTDAFLHMLCGTGLGLLFWLSWGLAAIVDVSWWVRGLSFAGVCWMALSLPATLGSWLALGTASAQSMTARAAALIAARWALTCAIAGLACAWSWERAV
jgi:hypothetical protein